MSISANSSAMGETRKRKLCGSRDGPNGVAQRLRRWRVGRQVDADAGPGHPCGHVGLVLGQSGGGHYWTDFGDTGRLLRVMALPIDEGEVSGRERNRGAM